ncbi:MAG: transposase [Urechidicola sp.]|jgi:transposase
MLFIGLDIHKKSWKFHFMSDLVVDTGHTFPPKTNLVFNYVRKNYPEYQISFAYEVGCCGYKSARDFISFGWDTFVVNPADIPRPSKSKFMKTDKLDAKNIARQSRAGNLKKITIPDLDRESLRSLTRQRTALLRDYRRIKTRIK